MSAGVRPARGRRNAAARGRVATAHVHRHHQDTWPVDATSGVPRRYPRTGNRQRHLEAGQASARRHDSHGAAGERTATELAVAGVAIIGQPRSTWRDRIALLAALSIAVAAHLGVLAILSSQLVSTVGAGGSDLAAVSMEITIVSSPALAGSGEPGTNQSVDDAPAEPGAYHAAAPRGDAAAQSAPKPRADPVPQQSTTEGPAVAEPETSSTEATTAPPTQTASDMTRQAAVVTGSLPPCPRPAARPAAPARPVPAWPAPTPRQWSRRSASRDPGPSPGSWRGTVRVVFALDEEGMLDFDVLHAAAGNLPMRPRSRPCARRGFHHRPRA